MGTPSRELVLSVALIVGLGGAWSRPAGEERDEVFSLVVIVHDLAEVSPGILDQALKEAARIYRQAGVRTEWVIDPARPSLPAFTVKVIIQAVFRGTRGTSKFLMGAATRKMRDCAGTVYVFHDEVVEFSRVQQIGSGLAMGTVIAHEIGHVLLQQPGHSVEGLMRASWDAGDWQRAASGFLLFSSANAANIRDTTSSCRQ